MTRSAPRLLPLAFLLAGLLVLALAPRADAATARMTSGGLVIDATADGDRVDSYQVSVDTRTAEGQISRWKVTAFGCLPAGIGSCLAPSAGCTQPGPGDEDFGQAPGSVIRCDRTAAGVTVRTGAGNDTVRLFIEIDPATVNLGAGNDRLISALIGTPSPTGRWTVDAGSGNDAIEGSVGGNTVTAGAGNDDVKGYPMDPFTTGRSVDRPDLSGDDTISGGRGADRIDAGAGEDVVQGGSGNDRINADVESRSTEPDAYDGGSGFDRIDYTSRTQDLFFNSGATQSGRTEGNPDELDRVSRVEHANLGAGDDIVFSLLENTTRRRYEGRAGDDDIRGAASADTIIGGPGRDRMRGFSGNDVIDARDNAEDELISCGPGRDRVELDPEDPDPVVPRDCETIRRR